MDQVPSSKRLEGTQAVPDPRHVPGKSVEWVWLCGAAGGAAAHWCHELTLAAL